MAKPTYKVWVVNQVTLGSRVDHPSEGYYFTWDQSSLSATVTTMKELFDEVCKHAHSKFQDAEVNVETLGAAGWHWRRVVIRVPLALPVPGRSRALAKPAAPDDSATRPLRLACGMRRVTRGGPVR